MGDLKQSRGGGKEMSLRQDCWTFIRLVGSAWWSLVGAMTVVATFVWLLRPDFPFSVLPGLFWLVSCLLVVLATFRVWRSTYHRVQKLVREDARLVFDPVRGERLVEVRISTWTIGPRLIAPKIGLTLLFTLVNHGTKAATLDEHEVILPASQGVSSIVFRSEGIFRYGDEGGPRFLQPGASFQPEIPVRVECRLVANVMEKSVDRFAQEVGKLRDFPLSITWGYHGMGESVHDEVCVKVSIRPLKERVFSHWEHDEERGDLVRLAREACRQARGG